MPKFKFTWLSSILAASGLRLNFCPSDFKSTRTLDALVLPYFKCPMRKLPSAFSALSALKSADLFDAAAGFAAPSLVALLVAYLSTSKLSMSKSNVYLGFANWLMAKLPFTLLSSIFALSGLILSFSPSALSVRLMLLARVLPYFKLPTRSLPSA